MSVPYEPASGAIVRRRLATDLTAAGLASTVIDDAVLIAAELVANAVRHGGVASSGSITVSWEYDASSVTVRVTDGGGIGRPIVRHPKPDQTSGRGLGIVEALAAGWGVDNGPGTTTVWASLRT
ncbi:MAG: ATP-binding protein [Actinobacteria bacterium]|nr:ATP-binding protein [Actinomycetota bacterium]